LAVAGAGLYFMRTLRPELSRDHDIFFAAVGLLSGFILIFQGWRLDPILQFSQLLLAGTAVFFAAETIRLRGFTTEQARRNSPMVDDEPSPRKTRVYRAELAQIDPYEEEEDDYDKRRLQGTRDRNNYRRNNYEEEQPRSRRPRRPTSRYTDEPPVANRPRNSPKNSYDDWEDSPDHWEDKPPSSRRPSRESKRSYTNEPPARTSRTVKKRRPKSPEDLVSSVGTEYVDYQPVDENEFNRTPNPKPEADNSPKDSPETKDVPNFDY
jgi:cell division septation protein DedD